MGIYDSFINWVNEELVADPSKPRRDALLPPAAAKETERVRQLLNPTGSGVMDAPLETFTKEAVPDILGGVVDSGKTMAGKAWDAITGIGEISPEQQGVLDFEREEFENTTGQLNKEFRAIPDTWSVDKAGTGIPPIEDPTTSVEIVDQKLQKTSTDLGQRIAEAYDPNRLSQNEDVDFFKMVLNAGKSLGRGLEMTYDGWTKLAPSTRTALIGAAATAYAYNKGWKQTAGDAAKITAGLYGNQLGAEEQTKQQVLKGVSDVKRAEVMAGAKGQKGLEANVPEATVKRYREEGLRYLESHPDYEDRLFKLGEAEDREQALDALYSDYHRRTAGNKEAQANTTWLQYLESVLPQ